MARDRPPTCPATSILIVLGLAVATRVGAEATRVLPMQPEPAWISSACERMLRHQLAAGQRLAPELVRRWGLDLHDEEPIAAAAPRDAVSHRRLGHRTGVTAGLAADVRANDITDDATCIGCSNRPLSQAETTIASLGDHLLVGWNDTRGLCTGGPLQGYGWSTDGGATWTDVGDMPLTDTGAYFRGDPVHAVDRLTGDFYVAGLCAEGSLGSGLALLRGHFEGGGFVVDDVRQIAVGSPDVLDKEWMDVASNPADPEHPWLYVTYSRFVGASTSQIELIVSTDRGVTWSAPKVLNPPETHGLVQGSRPAVGPDGELYVVWYESGIPSRMRIVRSDDHGATFGTARTVCEFYNNFYSGAPGFRRGRSSTFPGFAVDRSGGPWRGRVYVTWDESVNFFDAPFPASPHTVREAENNGFFANATPFTVGDRITGVFANNPDVDQFKFSGTQGQTLFLRYDTVPLIGLNTRLICAADTMGISTFRHLAFNQSFAPSLCFTLPVTGTYYLRLTNASVVPGAYALITTWDTPTAGERSRDHRDRFIAHSDDGILWSKGLRLNDDPPGFDGVFPEVTVDGAGDVHVFWHDFRDDPACGAMSHEYLTSSGDGGVTFGPNRRVSDAQSFWSNEVCGSANQGDYQGITSEGQRVFPCWADSRLGDPDAFVESDLFASARDCAGSVIGTALADPVVSFTLTNTGNVPGQLTWALEDDHGWLVSASPGAAGSIALAPGARQVVQATFRLPPDCAPSRDDRVRFITGDIHIPGRRDTCITALSCGMVVDAGAEGRLAFAPPRPNPSGGSVTLAIRLPRAGPVRLALFGADGALLRTLVDGELYAGPHTLVWDGRDERGRPVAAGVVFARLEAVDQEVRRAITILR